MESVSSLLNTRLLVQGSEETLNRESNATIESKNINSFSDEATAYITTPEKFQEISLARKAKSVKLLPVSELITLLQQCDDGALVIMSDGKRPHSFGSSRVNYADLGMGSSRKHPYWSNDEYQDDIWTCEYHNILNDTPIVKDILNILTTCKYYAGYKGGIYGDKMLKGPLWYTEFGEGNQQIVSGIKIEKDMIVMLTDYFSYW